MITDNGPIHTSASGEELWSHGTAAFPCGCYRTDLHTDEVPWHWHAEYEFGLCIEGLIDYRAGGERLLLRGGDAVFVNGGVPHGTGDGFFVPRLTRRASSMRHVWRLGLRS